jgi:excisionase family DNA binding protein
MTQKQLMSVTEAAEALQLGRSQILRLCKQSRFLGAEKVGKTWVIPGEAVEKYQPSEKGFAVVWKKRQAEQAAQQAELQQAIEAAKRK